MPTRRDVVAFLVALIVSSAAIATPAGADWQTWERSMETARRALEQGREATAEYWFKSVAREAERMDASRGSRSVDDADPAAAPHADGRDDSGHRAAREGLRRGRATIEVAFVTLATVQLADVLQRFRMTVDRPARRMTLEPASR